MKFVFCVSIFLLITEIISSELLTREVDINVSEHYKNPGGLWKAREEWKAHWVKQWEIRKIFVPVWKKVWGPVEVKEWIPFPEPPKDLTGHSNQEHLYPIQRRRF